jgi:hypothetical protein
MTHTHTHVDTYPLRNICALKSAIHGFDFLTVESQGRHHGKQVLMPPLLFKKKTEKKGTKDLTARITTLDATY